ncbi:cation transporter [Propioniciclava coleopterorum]|uniref:Cation transporter n=1 Tax=Propioniciclava coleopterorum TaxID=2714937 RepID=A0A6G7Y5L1_9ACTN|nr:cation diffusion facilitator family transporter [Propioniciclava coleopterorum]QIK72090.1 cation transporter [Propioniciclava coleopterorum]
MSHDHRHGGNRTRLAIAFGITAALVVIQFVGSIVTGSLALLTDTAHALTDASGLLVALVAATLMLRPATSRRTWGFARVEVLAALGQATVLLAVGLYTAVEGVRRLFAPPEVPAGELLAFGVLGLVANLVAIAILAGHRDANLNMRAAFLEVLNDALGSLGVIAAAVVIATTGFQRADALAGLFIAALIVPRAFRIMRETFAVLMEAAPAGVDLEQVREHLAELGGVEAVHDLHASTIGTGLPVVSAHLVVAEEAFRSGAVPTLLADAHSCLREHFPVCFEHATIQIETATFRADEPHGVLHA